MFEHCARSRFPAGGSIGWAANSPAATPTDRLPNAKRTTPPMRKRPSYWPTERSLFRDRGRRSIVATLIVWALSIAAAFLLVGCLRHPLV